MYGSSLVGRVRGLGPRGRTFESCLPYKIFGEMAEWSNAAVLKTVEGHTSGGSNPSLSALYNIEMYLLSLISRRKSSWSHVSSSLTISTIFIDL